ncbi:MAG: ABC transporter substrate-binding protein [Thermomicrobiales bacterium]
MNDEMNRAARPNAVRHALSRRRFLAGAATAAAGTILDACSGKSGTRGTPSASPGTATANPEVNSTQSARMKDLRMARNAEPLSPLIPWQIDDNASLFIAVNLYDTLLRTTQDGLSVEPGLATVWEPSPDSLIWTFTLHSGLKFSDGTPVTGVDVKTSLDQCISGAKSIWKENYRAIREIQTPDDRTVRVILYQPHPAILLKLAMFCAAILPADMAKASDAETFDATRSRGTGAYTLNGWKKGDPLVLTRNPNYWKSSPSLDHITIEYVPDDNARVGKLQSGETDVIDFVPFSQLRSLSTRPTIKAQAFAIQQCSAIALNVEKKPLDDVNVRQAMNYALDKEAMIKTVYFGNATAMNSPIPPSTYWDKTLPGYPFNVEKAKQLMAASSSPGGFSLDYPIPSGNITAAAIATIAKDQWATIGIIVTIQPMEANVVRQRYRDGTSLAFPICWTNDMNDPTEIVNYEMRGGASPFASWTRYNNPDLNTMVTRANLEQDPKKRATLYLNLQKIYLDAAPMIFLVYPPATAGWQKYVDGFFIDGLSYYRFEDVKVNK